jgi:hypothetical protein
MLCKDVIDINFFTIMHLDLHIQINKFMDNVVIRLLISFPLRLKMGLFLCMGKLHLVKLLRCWVIKKLMD